MLNKISNKIWTLIYNSASKHCSIGRESDLHRIRFQTIQKAYRQLCVTNEDMSEDLAKLRIHVGTLDLSTLELNKIRSNRQSGSNIVQFKEVVNGNK